MSRPFYGSVAAIRATMEADEGDTAMGVAEGWIGADNLWFLESLYQQYLHNPQELESAWSQFFKELAPEIQAAGVDLPRFPPSPPRLRSTGVNGSAPLAGPSAQPGFAKPAFSKPVSSGEQQLQVQQLQVQQLIEAYRSFGHRLADLHPLWKHPETLAELEWETYGLKQADLDAPVTLDSGETLTLRALIQRLQETYCGSIGVELMHIDDPSVRNWLQQRLEKPQARPGLSPEERLNILKNLSRAESFETFIHQKFLGAKRFSLEGGESLIALLDGGLQQAAAQGIQEVVLGMAHRGRLNVLVNILGKSPQRIFQEFEDTAPPEAPGGDVKYHVGFSADRKMPSGQRVHISLCFNPSHLGFVSAVALGRVRAKQDRKAEIEGAQTLALLVHGDAAFMGQGVTQEVLNMSQLPGYRCGGTVHVVLNNQLGFTTPPHEGRSSLYASGVARMLDIPIFHVNGEDPEAVVYVIQLALAFRTAFHRDVVVDMYCYRRFGHNEGDEPSFTQPLMYQWIAKQPTVRQRYGEQLVKAGLLSPQQVQALLDESRARLEGTGQPDPSFSVETPGASVTRTAWQGYCGGSQDSAADVNTASPQDRLKQWLHAQSIVPAGFHPNSKITRLFSQRQEMAEGKRRLDWAAAESLAFASLLAEGTRVRLSGQDSARGTFSHRHGVVYDIHTGEPYVPLAHISSQQAPVDLCNSPLSETGVLGFDYGYSLDSPDALVIWEAQFGDFVNGAQVIIDQFIAASEYKWNRLSGLVMLLPHGLEGQGPEHSSARLERFLTLAAHDNIQVAYPTTPAQFFHLLRRQVRRLWRKPLVVMTPKSLLRHPEATSTLDELAEGAFQCVIPDPKAPDPKALRRVLLCSGKMYYELAEARSKLGISDVALVRLELLYPNADQALAKVLGSYPAHIPVGWVQEEPRNMGAWPHLRLRWGDRLWDRWSLACVARPASASPARGSLAEHVKEQNALLTQALTGTLHVEMN